MQGKTGMQAEQAQAARLALLAQLARPVQHDVNNLFTVIFGNLDLLGRSAAEGAPQRQVGRIREAAQRLDAATRAMLGLARRPVPEDAAFAPQAALRALAPLLHILLPAPGALLLELPEADGWLVAQDRAGFDQAVLLLASQVASLPRGSVLGLRLEQAEAAVTLTLTWPPGAEPPNPAALAALTAQPAAGGWAAHWPRAGG